MSIYVMPFYIIPICIMLFCIMPVCIITFTIKPFCILTICMMPEIGVRPSALDRCIHDLEISIFQLQSIAFCHRYNSLSFPLHLCPVHLSQVKDLWSLR